MNWSSLLSRPEILIPGLALCIPIVAIVMGGITAIVKMVIYHRERMAMIQQGINPDRRVDEDDESEDE